MEHIPDLTAIRAAHDRIRPYIHRTPILTSSQINSMSGADIHFKCENFQKIGAFKARGAFNALLSLSEDERKKGVCTHSSGNHAQAVALAAQLTETNAYIVMPKTAPEIKKKATQGYGAEVVFCEPTLQAREDGVEQIMKKTGATLIHPFNDYRIIAGQATAAKELIEDADDPFDFILAPVGGGGLLSGTALSSHYLSPDTQVIGCEPEGADDAYKSFNSGTLIPQTNPNTIADGLLTSLGTKTFPIIRDYVADILTVNDQEIIDAMQLIWERMKIIIEPSCAVPLAALRKNRKMFKDAKVGIILTGGNVDLSKLPFN